MVRQPGSIGKLSTEVLDMIFQTILHDRTTEYFARNLLSCICFALGCKRLLAVGKRHIEEGLIEHHASAARCRLVCLGEYTDATDQAPAGMLTAEELKEIAATKVPAEDEDWEIVARNADGVDPSVILERYRCLYSFATEFWVRVDDATWQRTSALFNMRDALLPEEPEERPPKSQWKPHPHPEEEEEEEPEPREREDQLRALDRKMVQVLASYNATYPRGPRVLLNLSKGECVQEAALAVFGNDPGHVTLAHAMLSRICYSQDPGLPDEMCGDEFVGRCGRGPWAGDRFCIVSEKEMPALRAGYGFKEWKDVTEEVNRLLGNFWRAMDCDAVLAEVARRPKRTVYVAGTDSEW